MKSADSERDFNGFLRTACVEREDSQNNWRRRQFMDTVCNFFQGARLNWVLVDFDTDGGQSYRSLCLSFHRYCVIIFSTDYRY
jgi:hypothetical protein